jgi:hypothetical protein
MLHCTSGAVVSHPLDTLIRSRPAGRTSLNTTSDATPGPAFVTTIVNVSGQSFVAGFTDDCEIHYAPYPPVRGHDGVRQLIERHFSPDRAGFVCRKQLRAISGDVLGVVWCNSWTDRRTGRAMRSKGVEFWRMRGDRIARWDAAAVAWPDPADRDS